MAYSYIEYTANSSANGGKDYTYSFGAVAHNTANIKVNIGGTNLATSLYTVTQGTVTLSAAPGSGSAPLDSALSSSNMMRISRQTNRTTAEVTFSSASVLQDSDLNTANDQARFLALEAVDRSNESITIDESDAGRYNVQVDGADKRIFGVGTPSATNDAVPKSYADTILNSTKSHRDDALDHKDTAADYAVRVDAVVRLFDGATDNSSDSSPADQSGVYSAKEWAVGKHSANTDGSSKQWALGGGSSFDDGTAVSGSLFSAREYAQGDETSHGGSSKAWAIDSSSPDGSSEKSSKTLAAEAAASATAALASENAANASASAAAQVFDKFDDKYLGQMADGASATDADTTGTWTKNSSVITVASATNIVVGQEVTGSGIPTDANVIKVAGTSITISENMDAAGTNVDLDFRGQGIYGAFNSTKDGPATDNDGNALVSGALYFNTSDDEMRAYDGSNWIAASAAANVTVLDYTFNVTTNTTVFSGTATSGGSLSFASVESIDVFLNGIKLIGNLSSGNDYTLNASANSVTLASAAVNGDVVLVRVYKTFAVADAVPASSGGTFSGNVSFGDNNITNVGDIAVDTISSDAGTSIGVTLGTDSGDDFNVGSGKLLVEGDNGNVEFSGNGTGTDNSAKFTKTPDTSYFTIGGTAVSSQYKLRFCNWNGIVGGIKTLTNSTILEVNKSGLSALGGGGIEFDSGGDSSLLDDYEEGIWTPTITAQYNPTSGTWTFTGGTYTKIGRFVICSGKIKTTAVGASSGGLYLTLPLNSASDNSAGSGAEMAQVGYSCAVYGETSNRVRVIKYDFTTPIVLNHEVRISYSYYTS